MFENAKDDLIDALKQKNAPLTLDEAQDAIEGSALAAESTINRHATKQTDGVTEFVVSVEGGPTFSLDGTAEGDETGAAPTHDDVDDDSEPGPTDEEESADEPVSVRTFDSAGVDIYDVNGLPVTVDPTRQLAGEPTGDDWYGLPVLENGNDKIPSPTTSYFPVAMSGNRDSEEMFGRVLGLMNRPVLLEGEAGTGKNLLVDHAAGETNRIVQRINFGSDVSVFDLIGEKDIVDGQSVYILGKLAKAAMFGHLSIFDEVNMVSGDVSSFLHAVTEEVGGRQLELRGTDVTLTDLPVTDDEIDTHGSWYEAAREKWDDAKHLGEYIHPEFRVTATCNPLDYADTKTMNDAFRDRFVVMPHPYLPEDREAALLAEETDCDAGDVVDLVRLANVLREARAEANALSCPITHRSLLKTIEFAGPGEEFMSYRDAALTVMVEHASTKQDKNYIKDSITEEL